jgi:hypothetical protein
LHFPNHPDIIVLTEKEPLMSEVMLQEQLTVSYNPNLLVTYKYIPELTPSHGVQLGEEPAATFMTDKVTEIEWQLHQSREYASRVSTLHAERRGDIEWLEENVVEWYDPNYDKEDVLKALVEHFGINPVKEIEVQGTVSFSGTISVPMSEIADFDLSSVTIDVDLSSYDYEADLNVDDVSLEDHY